ncbi:efflux RND transporter periplasmic adaptor subunit [Thiorhodococcus mannitoliphagus]|uniref:Efflux RND transporter periplasmic adaptor subunit n=1 Tax=Thiorhodococcus mannitoliphagus TaxID=329406 RepID=A0A6P1DXI1_9GAMM|nr:efflux RND transporter periplasmic adaptor subunit [Thiorhodococcus mannitoliphagus]NEX20345.1 efflux RND transporter periplasmic adaptor subunit [Thiorhodococcus mannitoliphagus]
MPHIKLVPLFTLLFLQATLFLQVTAAQPSGSPPEKPTPVFVAEVRVEPLTERVEALGTLRANESVAITSNVTETISIVHFEDGQRVNAGALLVEMTSAEEHALLEEAQVRVNEAERQYKRVKSLVAQRSASESLLDERKRDLDTTRAVLVALESRLADRIIKAPFNGVLGLRNISRGALVEPGDLITTLDDDRLMKLDFSVPSLYLSDLEPGLKIEATTAAFGNEVFTGVVSGVDSRIDPITRSIIVRALVPNPNAKLRPGLLMQVELLTNPRQSLVIPEAALLHEGEKHFVMALTQDDQGTTAERRDILIGTRQPGLVEVREGIAEGERVVIDGNDKIRPGQPLKPIKMDDEARDLRAMTERAQ